MPKIKHAGFTRKLENASAFSFRVVESRMGRNYAKVFIHNLKRKGRIIELAKGWYSFRKSPYLITIPLGEAYIGLGAAAFLHNAWGQVPNIDVLTTRAPSRIRTGERVVAGSKVTIRRLDRKLYFGFETMHIEDAGWIRVSGPEKTLIDMIYYGYPFMDEILPQLVKTVDRKKLAAYLRKMECIRGHVKVEKELKRLGLLGKERE